MFILNEIITFEHQNEHVLEHDLLMKKNFSNPKIYTAKGDIKKRWYVYFSFRNPQTGKLERMKNIYGKTNSFSTKEERLSALTTYRRKLLQLLKAGFNPFEKNVELLLNRTHKEVEPIVQTTTTAAPPVVEEQKMTLKEAFDFGLKLKQNVVNTRTHKDYENRVKNLLKWIAENHPALTTIDQLTKKVVTEFLNEVLGRTSARSRNNYRVDLSSIVQVLEDNEIITQNFIKKIKVLKAIPERNKTYTIQKQQEIFHYLEKEDPILLLYIKFVSYGFLRPIEASRLRVGDLNLTNRTMQFKAKNSPLKTKIIPELLFDELPDLSNLDKQSFLFTPTSIGGEWDATEDNRRDYFTKRFRALVKDHFNLGKDHGIYSFRHTYITKVYRELVKSYSPNEVEGKLMLITGHATVAALRKYLRDIDAELPEDFSALLK